MSKPEQVLIIRPHELKFKGNNKYVILTVKNPTANTVFFKIKTTAPKKYCVRPNSGILHQEEEAQIIITPQHCPFDPNEKCKHKFMVQSIIAPADRTLAKVFKDAKPEQIMDSKLKCVFESPSGSAVSKAPGDSAKSMAPAKRLSSDDVKLINTASAVDRQESSLATYEQAETEELQVDVQKVLEENTKLKHEITMLREAVQLARAAANVESAALRHSYDPPQKSANMMRASSVLFAVIVGVACILIGKYVM